MKKEILVPVVILMCAVLLTGCFCKHDQWKEASCQVPRTCETCGRTEGTVADHIWFAATCEAPMTCQSCGGTEGAPLGHDLVEASCDQPKHCTRCSWTEGDELGHQWMDPTTEDPKTCSVCGKTEGDRIITDPRFTTASVKPLLGRWKYTFRVPAKYLEILGLEKPLNFSWVLYFGNAGDASMRIYFDEENAISDATIDQLAMNMYHDYLNQGMSEEEAREAIIAEYGVEADAHVRILLDSISINGSPLSKLLSHLDFDGVYYVKDNIVYRGLHWGAKMTEEPYTLNQNTLILHNYEMLLGQKIRFTRMSED